MRNKKYALEQVNTEIIYKNFTEHVEIYRNLRNGMFLEQDGHTSLTCEYFETKEEALKALEKEESRAYDSSSSALKFVVAEEFFVEEITVDNEGDEIAWDYIEFACGLEESKKEWLDDHLEND